MRENFGRRTGLQIDKLLIVIFPLLSILIIAFYLFGVGSETYITSTTTTTTETARAASLLSSCDIADFTVWFNFSINLTQWRN